MEGKAFPLLRNGVVLAFLAALLAGIFLPVYTDETGWRFQERAGFDGVDKLYSEVCGPNTLARPPFFMLPARFYSALFNSAFADPLYIRLSGIGYALLWTALLLALIRRLAGGRRDAAVLGILAIGLMALGNLPLLLIMSRPEQPIILAALGALLVVSPAWTRPQEDTARAAAWLRSLGVLFLATIAISYHLKAIFLMPLFLGAIWFAGRGRAAIAPRLVAGGLLIAMAAMAAVYWLDRMQCPDDPLIKAAFAALNIGAVLTDIHDWQGLYRVIGLLAGNVDLFRYLVLITPNGEPVSYWLPAGQIDEAGSLRWLFALAVIWLMVLLASLLHLVLGLRDGLRQRRIDARIVLAVLLAAAVIGWSATQGLTNFYEAIFVLPLLMLAMLLALSVGRRGNRLRAVLDIVAACVGLGAIVSPVLIASLWAPSLSRSWEQRGFIREQPYSVSIRDYPRLRRDILGAAQKCGIPEPGRARGMVIDELTYFAFMDSYRPQHRLGLFSKWKGTMTDPVAYLRGRGSDGLVIGCHLLKGDLRQRAKRQGQFCCLAPPNW